MTSFAEGRSYCRADMAEVSQRRSQTLGTTGLGVTKISGVDMLNGSGVKGSGIGLRQGS